MVLKWGERRIGLATIALCSLAAFIVPAATVQAQLSPPPPGMVVWLDPDVGLSEFQGPSSGGLGGGAGVSTRVRWLDKSPNGFIFEHSNHGEWAANSIASSVNPANKIQGHDVAFAGQNPGFVSVDNTGTATSAGNPIGSALFDTTNELHFFAVQGVAKTSGNRAHFQHGSNYLAFDFVFGGTGHQTEVQGTTGSADSSSNLNPLYDRDNVGAYQITSFPASLGMTIFEVHIDNGNTISTYTNGSLEGSTAFIGTLVADPTQPLWLGSQAGGVNNNEFGAYAEILVYTNDVDRAAVFKYLSDKYILGLSEAIPEPSSYALLVSALGGFVLLGWRRQRRRSN